MSVGMRLLYMVFKPFSESRLELFLACLLK